MKPTYEVIYRVTRAGRTTHFNKIVEAGRGLQTLLNRLREAGIKYQLKNYA